MDLLRQLVDYALQIVRQRTLEFHPPVLRRVGEGQARRMEKRTLQMRDRAQIAGDAPVDTAVDRVADDGMSDLAEVDADLVRAPRVDGDVRERQDHAELLRLD